MLWLNFLHFYQPANLEQKKLKEAVDCSYKYLLRLFESNSELKMTANFTGGLLERLATDLDQTDIIKRFRIIIERGQLEIVGSAAYHALLPLISKKEVVAQIKEQERLLLKHFGIEKPKGFFLPELAYSPDVAKIINGLGYEWILVDEITVFKSLEKVSELVFIDKNSGLKVIMRNRRISESYVPETLTKLIAENKVTTVVTATDAELYGLRHIDNENFFETLISNSKVKTENIGGYISKFSDMEDVVLVPSNWQSTVEDLEIGQPYKLWREINNEIHDNLSQLSKLAEKLFYKYQKDENSWWSRWHLWRGLQSCSWWWASKHDFREVFGPLAWSPDEVERGVNELIRSIRSLEKSTDYKTKIKAEKLAQKIRTQVWLKHWK